MYDWNSHAGMSFETERENGDDDEEDRQNGYDLYVTQSRDTIRSLPSNQPSHHNLYIQV